MWLGGHNSMYAGQTRNKSKSIPSDQSPMEYAASATGSRISICR